MKNGHFCEGFWHVISSFLSVIWSLGEEMTSFVTFSPKSEYAATLFHTCLEHVTQPPRSEYAATCYESHYVRISGHTNWIMILYLA